MEESTLFSDPSTRQFPTFDLGRLMNTVFEPTFKEKVCILIDLPNPAEIIDLAFLKRAGYPAQKKAHEVFYRGLKEMGFKTCDILAYETTGGNNLDLPQIATAPNGSLYDFNHEIYSYYDIILCISSYSATAPLTEAAKKFGFRGATLHGLNDVILQTGLSVDYAQVSRDAEKLRQGMTEADSIEIDFIVDNIHCRLFVELGCQEAQKSHGLCHVAPDIVNLPAGEVYFVPHDAFGSFPIKFEDGTLAILEVEEGRAVHAKLVRGRQGVVDLYQAKLDSDPATGILGEIGFGTQILPPSGSDIQDEKIFGTFHLAAGRNDHLDGHVTKERFINPLNATHEDILFSKTKTPEILVRQVRMHRHGATEVLIENNQPAPYLWGMLEAPEFVEMT
jgi:aminopeptidase